jgi:choline kinase/mannose-6-phosphate isomerase-like protein (cupin superfamily)
MKTIYKPWGREEWLELNEKYCYKRIYINAGYKTSYQYHNFKRETNYIISGQAEIWLENNNGVVEKTIMSAGEYFNVTPPKKHRVIALTDIILQEVSTPEVDDVIRLEDDTNRKDGKIESEHQTPAVLILAAGLGSRLKHHTESKNKALLPINNKAIISYIIDKFPKNYELVVAVGYKKDSLIEYCTVAHPDRKFTFVHVDKWENPNVGPGYSTLKCKQHLQKPFYIITADCLIDSELPSIDGNWLGVYPTSYPEKYSTINVDLNGNVLDFKNKCKNGYDQAFIGLASVFDYEIFWKELETNTTDYELVSAWFNSKKYSTLKSKELKWFDTGNLDDIQNTKSHFKDVPLSLHKNIDEITYKINHKFLKFNADVQITNNRYNRGLKLRSLVPNNLKSNNNFLSYDWADGITLYEYNSYNIYSKFLPFFKNTIDNSKTWLDSNLISKFYVDKTNVRKKMFLDLYDDDFLNKRFNINGVEYPSMSELLDKVDFPSLSSNLLYSNFHGDLQFDNIIYNTKDDKFTYIDWRESFAGDTNGGDLYYDLGKLYGGCLLPYNLLKNAHYVNFTAGHSYIKYDYQINDSLKEFTSTYENWLTSNGYNLNKVKLITGLIYLNMSPLHDSKFNKLLWFKSIELLNECVNK